MSKGTTVTTSLPISSMLGITFIVLKLCKVISWSWTWVLAPFWIPLALVALLVILYIAVAVLLPIFSRKGK